MFDVHIFDRLDSRLGRHKVHDPRSRAHPLPPGNLPVQAVFHHRFAPIWDQGKIGCCTADAALGCLNTGPLYRGGPIFTQDDAVALYEVETRIDDAEVPGHYPPDDTGSSGLWSAKALQREGRITGYRHAFTTRAALAQLAIEPVSIGIPWLQSMFEPDRSGLVTVDPSSGVAGGHQLCFDGIDPARQVVRFAQSWGPSFGVDGWGFLTWDDLDWLLGQGGDVTAFTVR